MRRLFPLPTEHIDIAAAYAVERPRHLRANMAMSLDGAATVEGRSGGLSGPADRALFHTLRALADVVLVGAATVRIEGYGPARLTAEDRARRRKAGRREVPPIAVVTGRLDLDMASSFFAQAEARPLLLTTENAPEQTRATAEQVAEVLVLGHDRVDLRSALDALAERGLKHVLCEGGPALLSQLVAAELVDEICLTIAPLLIGDAERRIADKPLDRAGKCTLSQLCEEDNYLFTRYELSSPTVNGVTP